MTRLHSGSWEERAEGMKKIKSDYESMKRRLNIATKRIEMMSGEVSLTYKVAHNIVIMHDKTIAVSMSSVIYILIP